MWPRRTCVGEGPRPIGRRLGAGRLYWYIVSCSATCLGEWLSSGAHIIVEIKETWMRRCDLKPLARFSEVV